MWDDRNSFVGAALIARLEETESKAGVGGNAAERTLSGERRRWGCGGEEGEKSARSLGAEGDVECDVKGSVDELGEDVLVGEE